jgi:hypothetical protein
MGSGMNYQWVNMQLEAFAKTLGAAVGEREKAQHKAMETYVDTQSAMLRRLLEIEARKLKELVEKQAKIIEAQDHRIKSIEAMFGQPGQEANSADRRLM